MVLVIWIVVNESDVSSDPGNWSLALHLGLDLESDTVSDWVSWELGSLSVDHPTLVGTIVALVPVDMSVVGVGVSVNVEASSSLISDSSSVRAEPSESLELIVVSEVSHNGGVAIMVPVSSSVLDRDGPSSVTLGSDGSGSPVEDKPLLDVPWGIVSDSQSVLVSTNVFMPEECSSSLHCGFDLESNSVSEWESWELDTLSINIPSLMFSVRADVEDKIVVHKVSTSASTRLSFEALTGSVSDVSTSSSPEGDLLVWLVSPGSDDSVVVWSVLLTVSVGERVLSSVELTDRVGSSVEGEPGVSFPWSWVLELKNVVSASNVTAWEGNSTA